MVFKKGEWCCLAASIIILLLFGSNHPPPQTAVSAADEVATSSSSNSGGGEKRKFSDLFKSDQLSAFLNQFQQSNSATTAAGGDSSSTESHQHHHKTTTTNNKNNHPYNERHNNNHRHPNRRMMLYDLSVRSHYERMIQQQQQRRSRDENVTLSSTADTMITDAILGDVINNNDNKQRATYSYYNEGLDTTHNVRQLIHQNENLFTKFSHWTIKLSRKVKLEQMHLEPVPLGHDDDDGGGDDMGGSKSDILKLPKTSLLANDIQFAIPVVNNLGNYVDHPLDTQTKAAAAHDEFESRIKSIWGDTIMGVTNEIEYYMDGDTCTYEEEGAEKMMRKVSKKRQSVVVYEHECCKHQRRTMDEFFQQDSDAADDDGIMILSASEPSPCKYIIQACHICPSENKKTVSGTTATDGIHSLDETTSLKHLLQSYVNLASQKNGGTIGGYAFPPMPPSQIESNKQLLKQMFVHAWDSYMYNAFPASELQPLTCEPGTFDLVRIPALTLIDTMDTLIIMNNYTEFARSVERLRLLDESMKREFHGKKRDGGGGDDLRKGEAGGLFSVNQNVSVFETTIRVLGGLLSAHQLAEAFMKNKVLVSDVWDTSGEVLWGTVKSENSQPDGNAETQSCSWDSSSCSEMEEGEDGCTNQGESQNDSRWKYDGYLLKLACDIGSRLLYAFDTPSGIPYGTVNLLHGVPPRETPVASLAGAGTLTLEFELLSRLSGNLKFGKAAKLATRALWIRRSKDLNLFGKHIDVKSGKWKEYLSGVGSNSDSFYEYLVKHHILFPDDADFWTMFLNVYSGIHDNSRLGEWYVDVDMGHGLKGNVRQVFESLMAFYPGMQILLGEVAPSSRTLNSFFLVREFLGLLPERFDFVHWKVDGSGDLHPLRPELLESNYFLHLASIGLYGSKSGPCSKRTSSHHTSSWLWAADFALHTVNKLSWRPCGFATVKRVSPTTTGGLDLVQENRDPEDEQKRRHISHHNEMPSFFLSETIKYLYLTFDAENNILHQDSEREWIFTTEAHPIHHAPVSSTPILSTDDNTVDAQIDKVRSLVTRLSNASLEEDQKSKVMNSTQHLTFEQWTRITRKTTHTDSIALVEDDVMSRKREATKEHGLVTGPHLNQGGDIYNNRSMFSEVANRAHYRFPSHGKGHGLGKRCPNLHHPSLIWTHALNGNTLDYNTEHHSSFSNEGTEVRVKGDPRMLSALAAACFYGTDYYIDGLHPDRSKICPTEEDPLFHSRVKARQDALESLVSAHIPGSKRYDMGNGMGAFDVSAFDNGDGFIVRHVDSGEILEVSIFYDELDSSDDDEAEGQFNADGEEEEEEEVVVDGDDAAESFSGATILVVLTLPTLPESSRNSPEYDKTTSLSSWTLSGWRKQLTTAENTSNITDARSDEDAFQIRYKRHVVVADLAGNSFSCEVILTEDGNQSHTFPCAPAFFGKASIGELIGSEGAIISGQLLPPPMGDELGCESLPFDHHNFCSDVDTTSEGKIMQLIRRGECNFVEKAVNQASRGNAAAMIVVNSSPNELFAMASVEESEINVECTGEHLPLSVMVNGLDGESIVNLLGTGKIKESRVELRPILEGVKYPHVKGEEKALKISAESGWGIHAVRQSHSAWQLFILQNTDN
jgi:mannosidase alpha-like ER degradation enhancer 2